MLIVLLTSLDFITLVGIACTIMREVYATIRGEHIPEHQERIYSSSCASDAQDTQDAQDVNSHSGCDVDPTLRPEDSLNVPLPPDNVLKRTLRPVHPDAF